MKKPKTHHDQWQGKPGGYALNASRLFASDNAFGIPRLRREPFTQIQQWLVPHYT